LAIKPTKKIFIAAVIKKLVLLHMLDEIAFAMPHKRFDFADTLAEFLPACPILRHCSPILRHCELPDGQTTGTNAT